MALQLILGILWASAADIYLSQSGAGAADGSSCADARAYTYFNTVGNWGAGATQIGPGTTAHVCGTLTIAANTNALIFRGSGTAGSPVTVKFEAGAKMTAPVWPSPSGAISVPSRQYVVIDGNWTGEIESTDAGSGLTHATGGTGVGITGSSFVEVKNLRISNLYRHTLASDSGPANGTSGGCVYANGFGSGISIHGLIAHDMPWCINLQSPTAAFNVEIYDNYMWRIDHGVAIGYGASTNSLTNLTIRNNVFFDVSNWDTDSNFWHHDGVHFYNSSGGGTSSNWLITENLFDGAWGNNNTAMAYASVGITNLTISNNVFKSNVRMNNGIIALGATITGSAVRSNWLECAPSVTNNFGGLFGMPDARWADNLITGCSSYLYLQPGGAFAELDRNVYHGSLGGGNGLWNFGGSAHNTISAWRTATGRDGAAIVPGSIGAYALGPIASAPSAFQRLGSISITNSATGRKMSFGGTPRAGGNTWSMRVHFGNPGISETVYCENLAAVVCYSGGAASGSSINLTGYTKYQVRYRSADGTVTSSQAIGDL